MTPDNKFGGSFGSNEWLVDEMYERYLADPSSVEENWREFFSGYVPGAALPTNGAPNLHLALLQFRSDNKALRLHQHPYRRQSRRQYRHHT